MSVSQRAGGERDRTEPAGDAVAPLGQGRARPSNVALKITMAVTGTVFTLFVLVHMIGNLKALMGPEEFNSYAAFLRTLLYPLVPYEGVLWILRIVLLVCLVAHVGAGTVIWIRGRHARGGHRRRHMAGLTWGARTMLLSGILVLAFVVVHLLDLTIGAGVASSSYQAPVRTGPAEVQVYAYQNLVASLSRPAMAIFYAFIMVVLGLHLSQGAWNVINDFGGTGLRLRRILLLVGILIALAIVIGNGALSMLILAGVIS